MVEGTSKIAVSKNHLPYHEAVMLVMGFIALSFIVFAFGFIGRSTTHAVGVIFGAMVILGVGMIISNMLKTMADDSIMWSIEKHGQVIFNGNNINVVTVDQINRSLIFNFNPENSNDRSIPVAIGFSDVEPVTETVKS